MSNLTFNNPILSGFYPDPSICRVGEDYYLATSSFSYFPGIPIFHSRDLVHWEQLGHAIHRPEQIDYSKSAHSEGLWAPTLRYNQGRFYIINTLVSEGREGRRQNYIVTAENPAGPWTDPIFIAGADGIDPSLFFDSDGKVWYCGNFICGDKLYEGHHGIYLCELDPDTFQFKGSRKVIWDGAASRSKWIEAPHLYKINGMYYLMVAEGGTFTNHSVMMARCREIDGEYEICPRNPIVTHRHLSLMHPISVTGHADIIETQNGEWWMVLLAVRPYKGVQFNLGRETFLVPIVWEDDGWPRVDNHCGLVLEQDRLPALPPCYYPAASPNDSFDEDELGMKWNMIRTLDTGFYSLSERKGCLRLYMRPQTIQTPLCTPAFIARRQQDKYFLAGTLMEFTPGSDSEEAGLCLIQSDEFNYIYTVGRKNFDIVLTLSKSFNKSRYINNEFIGRDIVTQLILEVLLPAGCGRIYLYVQGQCETYSFYYGFREGERIAFLKDVDASLLSTNVAGGFVGAYMGMYCSGNGVESNNYADFHQFEYVPLNN